MNDDNEPTPEELAAFHQDEDFLRIGHHQRAMYYRVKELDERQEAWQDENRDWMGDHPELFDGND